MVGAAGKAASWPEGTEGRLLADVGGRSVGIAGVESIGVEGLGDVADSIGCAGVESFGS